MATALLDNEVAISHQVTGHVLRGQTVHAVTGALVTVCGTRLDGSATVSTAALSCDRCRGHLADGPWRYVL